MHSVCKYLAEAQPSGSAENIYEMRKEEINQDGGRALNLPPTSEKQFFCGRQIMLLHRRGYDSEEFQPSAGWRAAFDSSGLPFHIQPLMK